ncbi:type II toxin-antitoxin system PemK/MazF family toxin [Mucilaginibacter koreensis]
MEIKQYAIHWINLDPTQGSEVNKTRPCVILSPDEMNQYIKTVIIAPLTHTLKKYPTRILCNINGEQGAIMLDQIRTVDKSRIGARLGKLSTTEATAVKQILFQMLC